MNLEELRIGDFVATRLWGEDALFRIRGHTETGEGRVTTVVCIWSRSGLSIPVVGDVFDFRSESLVTPNPLSVLAVMSDSVSPGTVA